MLVPLAWLHLLLGGVLLTDVRWSHLLLCQTISNPLLTGLVDRKVLTTKCIQLYQSPVDFPLNHFWELHSWRSVTLQNARVSSMRIWGFTNSRNQTVQPTWGKPQMVGAVHLTFDDLEVPFNYGSTHVVFRSVACCCSLQSPDNHLLPTLACLDCVDEYSVKNSILSCFAISHQHELTISTSDNHWQVLTIKPSLYN